MFVFGHLGITLGIAFILFQFVLPRIGIRPKKINYLFIAIGAILPDLIDKPIGRILLGESVANGRLFGHTLLFVLTKGTVIGENWYDYFLLMYNRSYVPALSYVFASEIIGTVILVCLAGFAICRVFFNGFGYRTLNHRWRER
jgi:hypothetical protein